MNENATNGYAGWTSDRRATLRLALSQGIGPCRLKQLLEQFGDPTAALAGLTDMRRKDVRIASEDDATAAVENAAKLGARLVLLHDADYPRRLLMTARPPIALHVIGDIAKLNGPMVAIVGARNASKAAKDFVESLAAELSEAGIGIVSGLARGIDGAAHRGSLGGYPVGVVAGGIDVVYPPEHKKLQHEISERGVLLAESPIGAKPTERHFPRRNRIVAGLAQAVIAVEAAERSGSLITTRFALEENREVMAVPGFPTDPRSAGANRLIRDGAIVIRSADDVLADLPPADYLPTPPPRSSANPPMATEERQKESQADSPIVNTDQAPMDRVRSALSVAPVTVDELSRECQLSVSALNAILLELELGGELERLPGQQVARR